MYMNIFRQIGIFFGLAVLFLASPVVAKEEEVVYKDAVNFSAVYVSQTPKDPITIPQGDTVNVTIKIKNTGKATWPAKGTKAISAYTMQPREHASLFYGAGWISKTQTPFMKGPVASGATGEITIPLTANIAPGKYREYFLLAAENYSWVKGGAFYLDIVVTEKKKPVVTAPSNTTNGTATNTTATPDVKPLTVKKFMQNFTAVSVKGGERIRLVLGFQNVGASAWSAYSVKAPTSLRLAAVGDSTQFRITDESWMSQDIIVQKTKDVPPSGTIREDVYVRAPAKAGEYTAQFQFAPNTPEATAVPVELKITVTEDAPLHDPSWTQVVVDPSQNAPASYKLVAEPRIRVGVWKDPADYVQFRSEEDDYAVIQNGARIGTLPRGRLGVFKYKNGTYSFQGGDVDTEGSQYFRLEPLTNPHAVFELMNFSRKLTWKGPNNFNKYRGAAEFRRSQDDKASYVINDLLMEDYAKGIGENANLSPMEYLKAQSIAQRTYAYYIAAHSDKHDVRNFDVVSDTGDQLYLGYENERIMPRFVEAAEATRGLMVLYNNEVVITPYFANTDGRTRAWTEVWGGTTRPWLVSVVANYDKERRTKLFGHGVGMSQIDASIRAEKEGLDAIALVKYYYRGVEVERMYQ